MASSHPTSQGHAADVGKAITSFVAIGLIVAVVSSFAMAGSDLTPSQNNCVSNEVHKADVGMSWLEKANPGSITGMSEGAKEIASNGILLNIARECGIHG